MKTNLFSYNITDLYAEITKRTSKLGQMRATETMSNLLDRLSLTEGEDFLFYDMLDSAVHETFDWVKAFARDIPYSLWCVKEGTSIDNYTAGQAQPASKKVSRGAFVCYKETGADDRYFVSTRATDFANFPEGYVEIHYNPIGKVLFELEETEVFDVNEINTIERALKEAIVNHVIYQWLLYAFPDEAERYYSAFDNAGHRAQIALNSETTILQRNYVGL